jgi:hypothetical protein
MKKTKVILMAAIMMLSIATSALPLLVGASNTQNPYLVRTFFDEEGRQIDEIIVPERPPEIKATVVMVPETNIAMGINVLSNVPAFDWCYGCSATSAAMMFGHYDNTDYTNMYAGPTNGGVCPMTNSVWGSGECPLSATHQGYDELTEKGHVDDYWYSYGSSNDPYYGNWPEHGYADCTADYMGTNQYYNWQNTDGSTTFYFYEDGAPLYDYTECESDGKRDGCHGIRLFVESRGYNVFHDESNYQNYNQYIYGYNGNTQGFTFHDFKSEIDAGRPVIIQVEGHSMLGYGYNTVGNKVYIHDTWDHSDHQMTWGGTYSGLQHYGVAVIWLSSTPKCDGTDTNCGIYPSCENCNDDDGCWDYGTGCEERDYYCKSNEEGCKYTYSNRHTDGWVDTGDKKWIDDPGNECKEKEQKKQEYRDYYCSAGSCVYSVTETKWVDTGTTRNKLDGTICGCTENNTLKRCYEGSCSDTGICNSTICGADITCDGKKPGESCDTNKNCNSTCKCREILPPANPVRDMPDSVRPGEDFNVMVNWTAPSDDFNAIGLTDNANATANMTVSGNPGWCTPNANNVKPVNNTIEYAWYGPYSNGTDFTAVYSVYVPIDVPERNYAFDGYLEYYIGGEGPFIEEVTGHSVIKVIKGVPISGLTGEVNCSIEPDVTVILYNKTTGNKITETTSDTNGNYKNLSAPCSGEYRVTASKAGFKNETREISITEDVTYTLNFRGEYGLTPEDPSMSYVLECVNHWKYPSGECGLTMMKTLEVVNAWLY